MLSYADTLAKAGFDNVEATVRKRRILFAGFMARLGSESLPKRVMFGEVGGGKGCLRRQEQDWKDCLEHDIRLFNMLTEANQWALAAKKSGKRFRRVEEAAEQYMKR